MRKGNYLHPIAKTKHAPGADKSQQIGMSMHYAGAKNLSGGCKAYLLQATGQACFLVISENNKNDILRNIGNI